MFNYNELFIRIAHYLKNIIKGDKIMNINKNELHDELVKHFPRIHFKIEIENGRITIFHDNEDGLEFSDNVASIVSECVGGSAQCIDILIDPSR